MAKIPNWVKGALATAFFTFLAGVADLRMAVARLETHLADMDRRVERIETQLAPPPLRTAEYHIGN